jgi:hypothetical protein
MSIETFELDTYAVSLITGEAERKPEAGPAAIIHGRTAREGAGGCAVYMRFYRPGAVLPPNTRVVNQDDSRLFMVSYLYDQLRHAIDLLRNEKPVYFKFNPRSNTGHLATSDEPVGEGEHDADFGTGSA